MSEIVSTEQAPSPQAHGVSALGVTGLATSAAGTPLAASSLSLLEAEGGGGGGQQRKTAPTGHHNNYSPSASVLKKQKTPAPPSPLHSPSATGRGSVRVLTTVSSEAKTNAKALVAASTPTASASTATTPKAAASAVKPKTVSAYGGAPKGFGSKRSSSPRRPARPPLTKKQIIILKQILREEEVARLELETQEAAEFTALGVSMQQSMMKLVNAHVQSGGEVLARLQQDNALQRAVNAEARAAQQDIMSTVSVTATVLKAFVDYHSSAEKEYVRRLEVENGIMKRQLDAKDIEISRQFAEIEGLRDSLSRLIIRTDVEDEVYRREVRAQMEKNALDVEAMKKRLQQRVDDTVLAIHKPRFNSQLSSLKEIVEGEQFKVQQAADELRYLIDQIGAEDRFAPRETMDSKKLLLDQSGGPMGAATKHITNAAASGYIGKSNVMATGSHHANQNGSNNNTHMSEEDVAAYIASRTMHSNFPRFYREQLQSLRKDALLRILDIVSFEPRVVTAVGHALASIATDKHVLDYEEKEEADDDEEEAEYAEEEEDAVDNNREDEEEEVLAIAAPEAKSEERRTSNEEVGEEGQISPKPPPRGVPYANAAFPTSPPHPHPPIVASSPVTASSSTRMEVDSIRDDDGGDDILESLARAKALRGGGGARE